MNKYLNFSFFLIFTVSIFFNLDAQELNEDFLASLPEATRKDFLTSMEQDFEIDEPELRTERDSALIKIDSHLEQIKRTVSVIEEKLKQEKKNNAGLDLKRFGSSYFDTYQTTFSPITNSNAPQGYIIDSGDILSIQFIGRRNEILDAPVNSDGTILLPDLGPVTISGLTLSEAQARIDSALSVSVPGDRVFIGFKSLRSMTVMVIGNAEDPGQYTVNGLSTILQILSIAGGISDNGSYREIIHKRAGRTVQSIDLYDFFVNGNFSSNFQILNGDVLLVSPKKKEVSISGGISNPAIFELRDGEGLNDLINFAGGLAATSKESATILYLNGSSESKNINDLPQNIDAISNIFISSYKPSFTKALEVTIRGAVKKPGTYQVNYGTKLSELIEISGGYQETAYPNGGVLKRERAKVIERWLLDKAYQDLILSIAHSGGAGAAGQKLGGTAFEELLIEIKSIEPSGRISTDFNLVNLKQDPTKDLRLLNDDDIFIPYFSQEIYVLGEVMAPGIRLYNPSFGIEDYISNAGGYARLADTTRVILIQPNGEAAMLDTGFLSFTQDLEIPPGSIIYTPKFYGKMDGINYAAVVAPVLSSIALTVASLNSIND